MPDGGVIINMSWDHVLTGMPGVNPQMFAAVKGGVLAFSKSLARTVAPRRARERRGARLDCDRVRATGWTPRPGARWRPPRPSSDGARRTTWRARWCIWRLRPRRS